MKEARNPDDFVPRHACHWCKGRAFRQCLYPGAEDQVVCASCDNGPAWPGLEWRTVLSLNDSYKPGRPLSTLEKVVLDPDPEQQAAWAELVAQWTGFDRFLPARFGRGARSEERGEEGPVGVGEKEAADAPAPSALAGMGRADRKKKAAGMTPAAPPAPQTSPGLTAFRRTRPPGSPRRP